MNCGFGINPDELSIGYSLAFVLLTVVPTVAGALRTLTP
jgi:hypothetical protein